MISLELLLIAGALGCDAFSVAISVGAQGLALRRVFRLCWHFALFQFMMPLIGLGIGSLAATAIGTTGKWVAALCLAYIGIHMAAEALKKHPHSSPRQDPTRGWSLIVLSVSTSVDALVAGFGLGLLQVNVLVACSIIGGVAGLMTLTGMYLGAFAAKQWGKWAELGGGVILVVLAVTFILR